MDLGLKGKRALVTGGSRGIGRAIVETLASQGVHIALCARNESGVQEALNAARANGVQACGQAVDVTDGAGFAAWFGSAAAELGGLDIVINGAAGNFPVPASQLSSNGFKAVLDIDLLGTFHVCRAAFEPLSKQGGVIVSITATQAFVPTILQAHVGAAKAGIEKLTKDLALEWGSFGIRVNTIAPGPVAGTEGMARLAPGPMADALQHNLPLRRYATIDEIAEGILFLVSPAGSYITGAMLLMDGGMALLGGRIFEV